MLDYSYMNMISHTMEWYPDHVGDHIILTSPLLLNSAPPTPMNDMLEEANHATTTIEEEHEEDIDTS
jgi:hypothetical protein